MKYALKTDPKKSARAYGSSVKISLRYAIKICRAINRTNLVRAKNLLQGLVDQKRSLNHKYHTNAAKEILGLLKSAEANAKSKGLDTENMVVCASAHKSFTFRRPRTKSKFAGRRGKLTNVQIVLKKG